MPDVRTERREARARMRALASEYVERFSARHPAPPEFERAYSPGDPLAREAVELGQALRGEVFFSRFRPPRPTGG